MKINLFLIIISKLLLACIWFILGTLFYNYYLLKNNTKFKNFLILKIKTISFLELTLILFCFIYILQILQFLFLDSFFNFNNIIDSPINYLGENNINTPSANNPSIQIDSSNTQGINNNTPERFQRGLKKMSSGGNATILAISIASASKIASNYPSLSTKTAILGGGIFMGSLGIVASNAIGNASADIGKKKFSA